jgi:hypothetical protein
MARVRLAALASTHSAFSAGVMIGILWAVWHLTNFFIQGAPQEGIPFIGFFLEIVAFSILMVWVYNTTNGSLLIPFLWYGAIIVISIFVPVLPLGTKGDLVPFLTEWGNHPAYHLPRWNRRMLQRGVSSVDLPATTRAVRCAQDDHTHCRGIAP